MTLSDVAKGSAHVAAHNDERHVINKLGLAVVVRDNGPTDVSVNADIELIPPNAGGIWFGPIDGDNQTSGVWLVPNRDYSGDGFVEDGFTFWWWSEEDTTFVTGPKFSANSFDLGTNITAGVATFGQVGTSDGHIVNYRDIGVPDDNRLSPNGQELPVGQQYFDNLGTGGKYLYVKIKATGTGRWRAIV